MRIEPITPAHLPEILSWWPARGEGDMQPELLPPAGFVAIDGVGPAAAAWLARIEGTPLAWVDWLVGRPGIGSMTARAACREVFAALEAHAREIGVRMLFAAACRHALVPEFQACGFVVMTGGVTHLAKPLP